MAENQRIRVGIVGANPDHGWGSGVHVRVIDRLPEFSLHAVCTTREESARRAASLFGAPLHFTRADQLACHPEIDLVSVCVKAPFHFDIARAALEAGKHVYCEWPLAITVEQAEELALLAKARGVKAMIGLHLRGAAPMRQAAKLIADGRIGPVNGVTLIARVFGPIMRAMAMRAGGTTLLSIYAGHLLDAVDHYFGGIVEIAARGAIHLPPIDETGAPIARDAFDHLQFHGRLENGALFTVDLAGVSVTGMGCSWRIDGREGSLVLTNRASDLPAIEALGLAIAEGGAPFEPLGIDPAFECNAIPGTPDRYPAYPGSSASREALSAIGNLYGELAHAIRTDGPITPNFARAVEIQKLLARMDAGATFRPLHEAGART